MNPAAVSRLDVDGRHYEFPSDTAVEKLDEWETYRPVSNSAVACVDIAAIKDESLYLIEVKDYDHPGVEQPDNLAEIVTRKVLGALGVLMLSRLCDTSRLSPAMSREADFAKTAAKCRNLVVVADIYTSSYTRRSQRNSKPVILTPKGKATQQKLRQQFKRLGISVQVHQNGMQALGGAKPFWESTLTSQERARRQNTH